MVDVPHWDIASKGRLMPGNIFLVDFEAGRVIKDEEVRALPCFPCQLSQYGSTIVRRSEEVCCATSPWQRCPVCLLSYGATKSLLGCLVD